MRSYNENLQHHLNIHKNRCVTSAFCTFLRWTGLLFWFYLFAFAAQHLSNYLQYESGPFFQCTIKCTNIIGLEKNIMLKPQHRRKLTMFWACCLYEKEVGIKGYAHYYQPQRWFQALLLFNIATICPVYSLNKQCAQYFMDNNIFIIYYILKWIGTCPISNQLLHIRNAYCS